MGLQGQEKCRRLCREIQGRLVAKGYNQRPGFDYLEIFAPTVRMPAIRVVLAMAATHDLHLCSIDISHAYLNGEIDCDVYMEQPVGFAVGDPRQMVCLLKKSIYGMKQGGNRWNQKMRSVREAIGYTQLHLIQGQCQDHPACLCR